MARRKAEINVIHVFRDGLVTADPTARQVPAEIVRQVYEIAESIRQRQAREAAVRSSDPAEADI